MDQQNGLFGFLENHVMGPMGKLAQFKGCTCNHGGRYGSCTIYYCWVNVLGI